MTSVSVSCRDEVAGCSERAYRSLTVEDAQRVLLMPNSQETCHYAAEVRADCSHIMFAVTMCYWQILRLKDVTHRHTCAILTVVQRGWDLREGRLFFQPPDTSGAHNVDALEIISNSMTYARELERIV